MRLLLPLALLALGIGGGAGAGLWLRPTPADAPVDVAALETDPGAPCGPEPEAAQDHAASGSSSEAAAGHDYIRLANQFVVPLLDGGEVTSLVMLSLSVEVPAGQEETVGLLEPKLRDLFLQALFDHANTGGFDGLFTSQSAMRELRDALLRAAQAELGGLVTDVLVLDLVRQEQRP